LNEKKKRGDKQEFFKGRGKERDGGDPLLLVKHGRVHRESRLHLRSEGDSKRLETPEVRKKLKADTRNINIIWLKGEVIAVLSTLCEIVGK